MSTFVTRCQTCLYPYQTHQTDHPSGRYLEYTCGCPKNSVICLECMELSKQKTIRSKRTFIFNLNTKGGALLYQRHKQRFHVEKSEVAGTTSDDYSVPMDVGDFADDERTIFDANQSMTPIQDLDPPLPPSRIVHLDSIHILKNNLSSFH